MKRPLIVLSLLSRMLLGGGPDAPRERPPENRGGNGRSITLADRIWAQTQIERVYDKHRIWPKENGPKPPFERMITRAQIEAKVNLDLKKSAVLDRYWQRPITPAQLQAELDRMTRGTRDGATLQELFAALHDDPVLIGECLVRPILADRLLQNWYANDERFHGAARRRAEAALASSADGDPLRSPGERSVMTTFVLREAAVNGPPAELAHPDENGAAGIPLDAPEFAREIARNPAAGGQAGLRETPDAFLVVRTTRVTASRLEVESLAFAKQPVESWLQEQEQEPAPAEMVLTGKLTLPAIQAGGCAEGWNGGSLDGPPDPRANHSALWTGSEMIVWGGSFGGGPYFNTGGRYKPATDSWSRVSTGANVPARRAFHAAVWTGGEMIVWGGFDGTNIHNTGGRYNPATDTWAATSIGANTPAARYYLTGVWTGSEMIVWGGTIGNGTGLNSGGRYDPATDTWAPTSLGANVPAGRYLHTALWTGSEMIIWGGTAGFKGGRYNPAIDGWLPISTSNVPPGAGGPAFWTGSEMIIGGGGGANPGGRYNPNNDSWSAMSTANAPTARSYYSAVWTGTEMIIWGGLINPSMPLDGGRYNPTTDSWTPTSIGPNLPMARMYHTAVWTGSEMIVWGGLYSGGTFLYLNSGGRYSPATDSWVPASAGAGMLAGRLLHTAVWTGSEMIVWGGATNVLGFHNTGGRYQPATDSWAPTSTGANVPAGRDAHTAIWTGSEMIVWGGTIGSNQFLNSGRRYNPATDAWAKVSEGANAPVARDYHTAVWSGSEMIVWGGYAYDGKQHFLFTGGRYDPATDSWARVSEAANVPTGRFRHTVVWTGSEMIVWGGNGSGLQNSGGRYNPAQNSWAPVSAGLHVPSPRQSHTAVWTGAEMIVWGGHNGGYLGTGGRYNPVTDSWVPSAAGANAAAGREYHTAVWTGGEMIVWGGYGDGAYLNSGGRYSPAADSWAATSIGTNAPEGRYAHTAVWTGSDMVVWGGSNNSYSYLNSGGGYSAGLLPASPGGSLRGQKSSSLDLIWSNSHGADSYNVRRCIAATGCIPGAIVATPAINQYSEPPDAVSYFYAVEAVNACGATP